MSIEDLLLRLSSSHPRNRVARSQRDHNERRWRPVVRKLESRSPALREQIVLLLENEPQGASGSPSSTRDR
jgi:hypothetical protein